MKLIRFELNDVEAAALERVIGMREFYALKPKSIFVMRLLDILHESKEKEKAGAIATLTKQPAQKETVDERKKREQAEFRERKLEEYRSTGEWPKVRRYEKGSGHKEGSVETHEGHILFTIPGDPARMMCWTPPEDYPHMADYRLALRELEQINASAPPVDPCKPKQEDFDTDEEFCAAENLYERTTERDAVDALPDLPSVTVLPRTCTSAQPSVMQ